MDRISPEITEEVGVLLEHKHAATCAGEQQPGYHSSWTTAHNDHIQHSDFLISTERLTLTNDPTPENDARGRSIRVMSGFANNPVTQPVTLAIRKPPTVVMAVAATATCRHSRLRG